MKKTKEEEQIYKDALSKYGDFAQLDQLVEEVGELLQALNKVKRKMPSPSATTTSSTGVNLNNVLDECTKTFGIFRLLSVGFYRNS